MGLIKCPECGEMISDKAKVCIHCGYPIVSEIVKKEIENIMFQEKWKKNHGIIPVISEDGKTVSFGLFPQSHVKIPEQGLIDAGKDKRDFEYFFFEGDFYVKSSGRPFKRNRTFIDGQTINNGEIYYFKCEPIIWNVVSINNGLYILNSLKILYGHCFDSLGKSYFESEIRKWLNNDFYNKAFFMKESSSYIQEFKFEEFDYYDKVWLGSKKQYSKTWYKKIKERQKKVTDFAICCNAYLYSKSSYFRNGIYWIFSKSVIFKNYGFIRYDGTFDFSPSYFAEGGVVPSLIIKF